MSHNNTADVQNLRVDLSRGGRERDQKPAEAQRVLADVYQLLEDYAPTWYSTELREKLQTALNL